MKKLIILLLTVTVLFNSCSEKIETTVNKTSNDGILVFNTYTEFADIMNKTLSMDLNQLKSFEESQGFKSFGRECDEFYYSINPDKFKSVDELVKFVNDNSKYLQMKVDEYGDTSIEVRNSDSPYKYIINSDQLYQVNNTIFKVLENGTIASDASEVELLKNINETNLATYSGNKKLHIMLNTSNELSKSTNEYCGDSYSQHDATGNERIVIKLWAEEIYEYDPLGNPWETHIGFHYRTYPQKRTLGAWFGCGRHITASFDATVHYSGRQFRSTATYNSVSSSNIEAIIIDASYSFGPPVFGNFYSNFVSYNCSSHIPKPCDLTASCN